MTRLTFANKKKIIAKKGAKDLAVEKAAGAPLCGKSALAGKRRGPQKSRTTDCRRKSKAKGKEQMQKVVLRKVREGPVGLLGDTR